MTYLHHTTHYRKQALLMTDNIERKQQALREHRIWTVNFIATIMLFTISLCTNLLVVVRAVADVQPIASIESAVLLAAAGITGFIGAICSVFCDWHLARYLNLASLALALAIIGVNLLQLLGLLGLSWNV